MAQSVEKACKKIIEEIAPKVCLHDKAKSDIWDGKVTWVCPQCEKTLKPNWEVI